MLNTEPFKDEPEEPRPLVCVTVKTNGEVHLIIPSLKLGLVLNGIEAADLGQALLTCGYFSQGMKDASDLFPPD